MNKPLLLTVALLLFSSAALASYPYIAIYGDADRTVTEACGIGFPFTIWIWHHPNPEGLWTAEFAMTYPEGCVVFQNDPHPDIHMTVGDPTSPSGGTISFQDCHYEWIWSFQLTILPALETTGYIEVLPSPENSYEKIQYLECNFYYTLYEPITYNKFGYCVEGVIESKDTSWGAIKGMITE
ncbi:MAG: hypothetical protein JXB45_03995 [Candidatus Krumholzibacteriota bacterium]|nr:hypothetical protein [Candidatus Krumholzibacteriota bacterium]